jgi:hypothetical protein
MRLMLLAFLLARQALGVSFAEHVLATDLKGGYQVVAVDLNHDGHVDLIALASGMPDLVWFENPGPHGGDWQRHVIVGNQKRMINCAAWDFDGDGIPEIVLATEFANQAKNSIGVVSVLHHQGDPRKPWSITEIDQLTTSHRLRWADIDGSGKRVLVNAPLTGARAEAPDYRDRAPLVYYRPGDWKRQFIGDLNQGVQHGIYIFDWDGDGRDKILTASFSGIDMYTLTRAGKWERTEIAKGDPSPWPKSGSSDVTVGRIGKQRFIAAIEPWHGNEVAVYTQQAKAQGWSRNVIDDKLVNGHTILTADFDHDGNDEIIAGFRGKGQSVFLYRFEKGEWTKTPLDEGGIAAAACAIADLNEDGKPDVACIGSATTNLKWYENRR